MADPTVSGLPADVYLEDAAVGFCFETRRRIITQADIDAFAELTGDRTPIHTDAAFSAERPYRRPIAHGAFGLSLMIGLTAELKLYQRSSVAALGWENARYLRPMFAGDSVHAKVTYAAKRVSRSNPARGVLREHIELVNQNGEIVTEGDYLLMLEVRAPGSSTSSFSPP